MGTSYHLPSFCASVTSDDNPSGNVQIMGKLSDGVTVPSALCVALGSHL